MDLLRERLKARGAQCAVLMGDGGDSSQSSATTTTSTTNAADRRVVADAGALVASEGSTINVTQSDLGSIQGGINLAEKAILGATKATTEANAKAGALAVAAIDLTKGAVAELKGAYESSGKQIAVFAAIFIGGLALYGYVVKAKLKKG